MPSFPTPNDVHIDTALSNMSIAHLQRPGSFEMSDIFPIVDVQKASDKFFVWNRSDLNRDEAQVVGPAQEAPVGALRVSNDSYSCEVNKWALLQDEQTLRNADSPLMLDRVAAETVANKLALRQMRKFVSTCFTTSVWTGSTTGTDVTPAVKWDVYATSTPIDDIEAEITALEQIGLLRSEMKMVIPPLIWKTLKNHPSVRERYQNVMPGVITPQLFAAIFEIGKVIVPKAAFVSSAELAATTVSAFVFNVDGVLILWTPSAAAINTPSAGYLFRWSGLLGMQGNGIRIIRFWDPKKGAWHIQGEAAFDPKPTSTVCGAFFTDVLT